jgi:hypothetical protein
MGSQVKGPTISHDPSSQMRDPIDSFIDIYVQALRDQNAAIFAGAGLSIAAGLVNWKERLKDIALHRPGRRTAATRSLRARSRS